MTTISLAESEEQIRGCYPVMAELRPHVVEREFVERVRRQQRDGGYHLAFVEESGSVRAVAGFRIAEFLAWGRTLYVDDLVTASVERSRGHGQALFDWLIARAKSNACAQLHLDSGVQRFDAHRFYLRHRMSITSHHFSLNVS
jgi:GNAT superfamily N-acetyltransferase